MCGPSLVLLMATLVLETVVAVAWVLAAKPAMIVPSLILAPVATVVPLGPMVGQLEPLVAPVFMNWLPP